MKNQVIVQTSSISDNEDVNGSTQPTVKAPKSTNFSGDEKALLITVIEKYKGILECQTTNKKSNAKKDEAWEKITRKFNAQNATYRKLDSLKNLYGNLKRDVKKAIAQDKVSLHIEIKIIKLTIIIIVLQRETKATGGGSKGSTLTTIQNQMASYMGDSLKSLSNPFDSNAKFDLDDDPKYTQSYDESERQDEQPTIEIEEFDEIMDTAEYLRDMPEAPAVIAPQKSASFGKKKSSIHLRRAPKAVSRSVVQRSGMIDLCGTKQVSIGEKGKTEGELFELRKELLLKQLVEADWNNSTAEKLNEKVALEVKILQYQLDTEQIKNIFTRAQYSDSK